MQHSATISPWYESSVFCDSVHSLCVRSHYLRRPSNNGIPDRLASLAAGGPMSHYRTQQTTATADCSPVCARSPSALTRDRNNILSDDGDADNALPASAVHIQPPHLSVYIAFSGPTLPVSSHCPCSRDLSSSILV